MFIPLTQVRARVTRQAEALGLVVLNMRSKMGHHAFSYRGAKCLMELDPELRQVETLIGFKNELIKRICRDINHPT